MKTIRMADLSGPDWSGPTYTGIGNAAVKLRWIDSAFRWHRNVGPELFFVLDGKVDMHVRPSPGGNVTIARLRTGEGVWIEDGQEHVAYPDGPARVLVVERDDR